MTVSFAILLFVVVLLFVLVFKAVRLVFKLLLWALALAAIYWVVAPFAGLTPLPEVLESRGLPVPAFMDRDNTIRLIPARHALVDKSVDQDFTDLLPFTTMNV